METKPVVEISMGVVAIVTSIGVMKTKTQGRGPRSIQAIVIALGVPAVVILAMEGILNSQAVAAIIGGMVGFGAGKATS